MREPLVLVPGIDGTGLMYHRQVPRLERRFIVTTMRLRDEAERMTDLVEDLHCARRDSRRHRRAAREHTPGVSVARWDAARVRPAAASTGSRGPRAVPCGGWRQSRPIGCPGAPDALARPPIDPADSGGPLPQLSRSARSRSRGDPRRVDQRRRMGQLPLISDGQSTIEGPRRETVAGSAEWPGYPEKGGRGWSGARRRGRAPSRSTATCR